MSRLWAAKKYHDKPTRPAISTAPSAATIEAGSIGAAMMMASPNATAATSSAPMA